MDPGSKYGSQNKVNILSTNVEMTRFLCMHKIFVQAQESCAGTRVLCMHKSAVHAQESRACTRILCTHKNLDICDDLDIFERFSDFLVKAQSDPGSIQICSYTSQESPLDPYLFIS